MEREKLKRPGYEGEKNLGKMKLERERKEEREKKEKIKELEVK